MNPGYIMWHVHAFSLAISSYLLSLILRQTHWYLKRSTAVACSRCIYAW